MKQLLKRHLTDRQLRILVDAHSLVMAGPLRLATRLGLLRPRYRQLAQLVESFNADSAAPELLYLGDSVVERVSRNDSDRRTLGAMVSDGLAAELRTTTISNSAYHLGVFLSLLSVLWQTRHRPRLILFPINLRSFSPQWDFNPQWQFDEEMAAIDRFRRNTSQDIPRLRERVVSRKEWDRFDATKVEYPATELRCIGQFRKLIASFPKDEEAVNARRREILVFHYMHRLASDHPRLAVLDSMLERVVEFGCAAVGYVTPLNYAAGTTYVGPSFLHEVRRNVDIVSQVFNGHDKLRLRFLDLSQLLECQYFFSAHDAAEHLNELGRRRLAERLAAEILDLHHQNECASSATLPNTPRGRRHVS